MLLASLKCKRESALAFLIDGHAREAAWKLANKFLPAGDIPGTWSAKGEEIAALLSVTYDYVGTELSRRREHSEAQGIAHDNQKRAECVGSISERFDIFDRAEEVRILHNQSCRLFELTQFFRLCKPIDARQLFHIYMGSVGIGLDD